MYFIWTDHITTVDHGEWKEAKTVKKELLKCTVCNSCLPKKSLQFRTALPVWLKNGNNIATQSRQQTWRCPLVNNKIIQKYKRHIQNTQICSTALFSMRAFQDFNPDLLQSVLRVCPVQGLRVCNSDCFHCACLYCHFSSLRATL